MVTKWWRRAAAATGVVIATSGGLLLAPALAQSPDDDTVPSRIIEIPLGTVVRDEPGSLTVLAEVAVPADLQGRFCDVESRAQNNASTHTGNDLLVASDGTAVELLDVEAFPGKITAALVELRLGPTVRVTLRMGTDGVFSAGSSLVVLDCPTTPPTTTTTVTPPSSTSTTTPGSTTTVVEPPASSSTTTTVIEPPSSSSTTSSTTTSSSTTSSTTTTVVEPPSSTSQPPPTTTVPGEPELPNTGPGTMLLLAGAGIILLDLGYLTITATRPATRRRPH